MKIKVIIILSILIIASIICFIFFFSSKDEIEKSSIDQNQESEQTITKEETNEIDAENGSTSNEKDVSSEIAEKELYETCWKYVDEDKIFLIVFYPKGYNGVKEDMMSYWSGTKEDLQLTGTYSYKLNNGNIYMTSLDVEEKERKTQKTSIRIKDKYIKLGDSTYKEDNLYKYNII